MYYLKKKVIRAFTSTVFKKFQCGKKMWNPLTEFQLGMNEFIK